jgi:hypothetical protein
MILIAKDEAELQAFRDKLQKLKVVALDEMGFDPLDWTINRRQKDKVLARIEAMWDGPDCTPLFNEIISKTLFDKPDMSVLPCGQTSYAPQEDKEHIPWKNEE